MTALINSPTKNNKKSLLKYFFQYIDELAKKKKELIKVKSYMKADPQK